MLFPYYRLKSSLISGLQRINSESYVVKIGNLRWSAHGIFSLLVDQWLYSTKGAWSGLWAKPSLSCYLLQMGAWSFVLVNQKLKLPFTLVSSVRLSLYVEHFVYKVSSNCSFLLSSLETQSLNSFRFLSNLFAAAWQRNGDWKLELSWGVFLESTYILNKFRYGLNFVVSRLPPSRWVLGADLGFVSGPTLFTFKK